MLKIGLAVVLVAALGACSSGEQPVAQPLVQPLVKTTTAPAQSAADSYDGVQRLVGALNGAGIACSSWETNDRATGAKERGSCYVGSEQIVASVYETALDATSQSAELHAALVGISDVNLVVGGNWTLSCDSAALCVRIANDFGGSLVHIPA